MALPLRSVPNELNSTSDESNSLNSKQLAEYLNEDMRQIVMPTIAFIGVEMVLGFVGNLLVLYVFGCRYHVCNYKYFVLSLATIDTMTTVTTMPGEMLTQLYWYVYSANIVCKVKSFCNVFTVTVEALCLLAIAIDRYRKVCRPLAWQIKAQHAKFICLGIPFVAFFFSLPTPFLWGERTLLHTYKNLTGNVTICEKDEKFESTNYPLIYISLVSGVLSAILAFMLGSYIYVFGKLFQERRRFKTMKKNHIAMSTSTTGMSPSSETLEGRNVCDDTSDSGIIDVGDTSITGTSSTQIGQVLKNDTMKLDILIKKKEMSRTGKGKRVRRKTLIMFILTLAFIATTLVYLILVSIIASSDDILQKLSHARKALYFFFLRLYFINHVINPFIYGVLDPEFKQTMKKILLCRRT